MSATTRWDQALEVARWEFRRFVKPKQLLVSMLLTIASAAAGFGVFRLFDRDTDDRVTLAVVGAGQLGIDADTLGAGFAVRRSTADELPRMRTLLAERELDGVLVAAGPDSAELVVRRSPAWRGDLVTELSAIRQRARIAESGFAPEALGAMLAPVGVAVVEHGDVRPRARAGERMLGIAVISLAFVGLMSGLGYVFAGITGEKQQRITEQIVSAVPPQSWMDGKILGLAAVALLNAVATGVAIAALFVVGRQFASGLRVPIEFGHPMVAVLVVLVPLLGYLLWFSFLCAVAAVIDDPNSSAKGSLLMVPMATVAVAGFVFVTPEGAVSQFFSLFPLTSWVVLPTRLLLADVPWWEVAASIALLLATTWLFRRAAGKIFAVGMLMYGKEPTVGEMWRWAREG